MKVRLIVYQRRKSRLINTDTAAMLRARDNACTLADDLQTTKVSHSIDVYFLGVYNKQNVQILLKVDGNSCTTANTN